MYDLSFYPNMICDPGTSCYNISLLFQTYGGLAQAIISNEIAFTAYYTIACRQVFDALKHKLLLTSIANIPPFALVFSLLIYIGNGDQDAFNFCVNGYFYLRIISILVITITCALTLYSAWNITKHEQTATTRTTPSKAIWALSRRLLYYPVVQVIARLGLSIFEWEYGFQNFNVYDGNRRKFVLQCVFAITTPFAAVGYLIIFLAMQPNALNFLLSRAYTGKRYAVRINDSQPRPVELSSQAANDNRHDSQVEISDYDALDDDELLHRIVDESTFDFNDVDNPTVEMVGKESERPEL